MRGEDLGTFILRETTQATLNVARSLKTELHHARTTSRPAPSIDLQVLRAELELVEESHELVVRSDTIRAEDAEIATRISAALQLEEAKNSSLVTLIAELRAALSSAEAGNALANAELRAAPLSASAAEAAAQLKAAQRDQAEALAAVEQLRTELASSKASLARVQSTASALQAEVQAELELALLARDRLAAREAELRARLELSDRARAELAAIAEEAQAKLARAREAGLLSEQQHAAEAGAEQRRIAHISLRSEQEQQGAALSMAAALSVREQLMASREAQLRATATAAAAASDELRAELRATRASGDEAASQLLALRQELASAKAASTLAATAGEAERQGSAKLRCVIEDLHAEMQSTEAFHRRQLSAARQAEQSALARAAQLEASPAAQAQAQQTRSCHRAVQCDGPSLAEQDAVNSGVKRLLSAAAAKLAANREQNELLMRELGRYEVDPLSPL